MLSDLPFIIIREIIKRIIEYESIDNLINLNKKLKFLIINDRVCQEHYLLLKYNLIIDKEHLKLIKLLNLKNYSKYIGKGFSSNNDFNIFVRPKDDKFIIIRKYPTFDRYVRRIFKFSETSMIPKILRIFDEKIEDFENILITEGFFYLNLGINKFYFETIWFPNCIRISEEFDIQLYFSENFDPIILQIINEL